MIEYNKTLINRTYTENNNINSIGSKTDENKTTYYNLNLYYYENNILKAKEDYPYYSYYSDSENVFKDIINYLNNDSDINCKNGKKKWLLQDSQAFHRSEEEN